MDHFLYRKSELHAEDVPLSLIAEQVGTPFYCYSKATLIQHYDRFAKAFQKMNALVCYAVKANSNLAVVKILAKRGAGAALVSGGELKRALIAGVPAEKIVFSGVGKTRDEMAAGLKAGILQFNVESEAELEALSKVASSLGLVAKIAVRVNPDVDAGVHAKITTGRRKNKFGIEWTAVRQVYLKAASLPNIKVNGISVHIGSQITNLEPFKAAFLRLRDTISMLREDHHDINIIDVGGGLGISYNSETSAPTPEDYAAIAYNTLNNLGSMVVLEPGRMISGNAGLLVTRMIYRKESAARTFYIVDAAMNDLIRPTLYEARHDIVTIKEQSLNSKMIDADIVGPICESGDVFAERYKLPSSQAGDLLALRTSGAYAAVMASHYNTRALVPEVLVSGKHFAVVRERITVDDLLAYEKIPAWV